MILNILTINRAPNNYLDKTIESLRASDWQDVPVNLIMGSEDESHVEAHRHCFGVVTWDKKRSSRPPVNFCLNYIRALRHQPDTDVVICEDDVEFSKRCFERLALAIAEIPFLRYVLSLFSACDLSHPLLDRGRHYRAYWPKSFYGTQAVYYPSCVRLEVAQYIEDNIESKHGDVLIGDWCNKYRCLYNTQLSLVQHIGVSSSMSSTSCRHVAWNYTPEGVHLPQGEEHQTPA